MLQINEWFYFIFFGLDFFLNSKSAIPVYLLHIHSFIVLYVLSFRFLRHFFYFHFFYFSIFYFLFFLLFFFLFFIFEGISALEDFADDFYSVSVPAELVIETNNNRPPSPFLTFCSEKFWSEQCKWDHRLALKLIYEKKGFNKNSKLNKQPWCTKWLR